ncbi:MAG: hypothetical protein KY475_00810 [Planctomycetes bacterium]|nr:hypothetical protein [Planctomycetota bacterium]
MTQQHQFRRHSHASFVLLLATTTALACVGCGGEDWQAETYPAHGRITINGQPPVGAVVELHSTGEQPDVRNSRPWAIVQEDGAYTLSTYEKGDGAPAGDYAVVLRWPPDVTQPSLADRLGGAYAVPERSQWNVMIGEGENELPPIEITGAKVLSAEEAQSPRHSPPGPGMGK